MAWIPTEADRDKLAAQILGAGVVQSMTFGDQTVQFRSLKEMTDLLGKIEAKLAGGSRTRYAAFDKGV